MMPAERLEIFDVRGCARCGGEHARLVAKRFARPHREFLFWAECPTSGDPILVNWTDNFRAARELPAPAVKEEE